MKSIKKQSIAKILKRICAFALAGLLIFVGYLVLAVHFWSITDEGKLPPKTAVILHAVNERIITSDMKPPQFLTTKRPATIARENITLDTPDGGELLGRVYYPIKEGPHPIILYFHGGAFMEGYGNIDTHDNIIRVLSSRTNSVVIAVGYRLAPDYVFPTAVEDSYQTLNWAVEHGEIYNGDSSRIAVVGDSAGGNLATALTLMTRDLSGPPITAQVLLYPLTTFQELPFQSREIYDSGYYLLSRSVMYRARDVYTPNEEMWLSPYSSPLNAEDHRNLPQTLLITAEYDPLKDEGQAYAEVLANAGVQVKQLHYEGVMHGFISFYEVMNRGKHGLGEVVSYLKEVLAGEAEQDEPFVQEVITAPRGREAVREYIEAYAIAAYLLYLQIVG